MELAFFAFLATTLPLIYFLLRILPAKRPLSAAVALVLALGFGLFLFSHHHEDAYSGLDTAAYGIMADAFSNGHPIVSQNKLAASIPQPRIMDFLYRLPKDENTSCRPTLDRIFQIDLDEKNYAKTFPYFMPMLSLAEAGSGLGRNFIPLIGALWIAILFISAIRIAGISGLIPALALILATAYPMWFFRGEFAEAIAFPLVTATWLSASARPFKHYLSYLIAGFSLTFALAFHLTTALVAAPIALALIVSSKQLKYRLSMLIGALAGFIPLWLITRYVCAPYGNWTKLSSLAKIATSGLEHSALFFVALLLTLLTLAVIILASNRKLRALAFAINKKIPTLAWLILGLAPAALLSIIPTPLQARFNLAINLSWQSLHIAPILLWVAASLALLHQEKRISRRILWLLITWASCAFLLIIGQEVTVNHGRTVGTWSFRRVLPIIIAYMAILALPLAEKFSRLQRLPKKIAIALLLVLALYTPIRHPLAYRGINGAGAEALTKAISSELSNTSDSIVIFDYFLHAVPFASKPDSKVLGLGDHARSNWRRVAAWISTIAQTGTVHVVSSYTPPKLELDMAFEPIKTFEADLSMITASTMLNATKTPKKVTNTILKPIPLSRLSSNQILEQEITFDGSPIGIRGDWHFTRKGGAWSQSNSGIVAPLPSPGTNILAKLDISWFPPKDGPTNQTIRINYPGNPYLMLLTVQAGRQTIETTFVSDRPRPAMGIYTISAPRPYDPSQYGIKGFPKDLGVFLHKATFTQQLQTK